MVGVVMGNAIDPDNEVVGIPANHTGPRNIYVSTNQTTIYEAEVSGTLIENSSIGLNVTVIPGTSTVGSLSTSAFVIDGTTNGPAVTATFPFRLVGITEYDINDKATKVLVRPNATSLSDLTGV
jgi:hypothetical protein